MSTYKKKFNIKKKIILNYHKSANMFFFFKGFKNKFETAVANEPSVCVRATEVLLYKAY